MFNLKTRPLFKIYAFLVFLILGFGNLNAQTPNAVITSIPTNLTGDAPFEVDFSGTNSTGNNLTYFWTIEGDPTLYTSPILTDYTFNTPGTYIVYLTVQDPIFQQNQTSVTVTVTEPPTIYTTSVVATDDNYLQGGGASSDVFLVGANETSYLKFDLSNISGKITNATLRLATERLGDPPVTTTLNVYEGSHNNWIESNLSNANKPSPTTLLASINETFLFTDQHFIDLGPIPSSEYSLVLTSPSTTVKFASSENDPTGQPILTLTVDNRIAIDAKAMLMGAEQISGSNLMHNKLQVASLLPTTDPYGLGTTATSLPSNTVDWVKVELRDANDATIVVAEAAGLLLQNGDIVNPIDFNELYFDNIAHDDYYIAIRHRNHTGVMTANAESLSSTPFVVDFTDTATATWGTNAQEQESGKMMMYVGNVNEDKWIKASGPGFINDGSAIIQELGRFSGIISNEYNIHDLNMDGDVRASGPSFMNDYAKLIGVLGSFSNTIHEQLPEHNPSAN